MIVYRFRHRPSRAALSFFLTGTAFATGKPGGDLFFKTTKLLYMGMMDSTPCSGRL